MNLVNDEIFTAVHSVMTFNMCLVVFLFQCFSVVPPPKKKMTMAHLHHLEIGIDAPDNML